MYRLIAVCVLVFVPAVALGAGYNDLQLTLEPQIPGPGDTVSARVYSYSYALDDVPITWKLGDVAIGTGDAITFRAPSVGTSTLTVEAGTRTLSRVIAPASVDLLWEADTYTPSFYGGRALPSPGSTVTLTAIPQVATSTTTPLIFKWYENAQLLTNASGVGMSTISRPSPRKYDAYTITVEVLQGTTITARKSVRIASVNPELLLYGTSPLIGTLHYTAYTNSGAENTSPTILPFFFTIKDPGELKYSYTTYNGVLTAHAEQPHILLQTATLSQKIANFVQNTLNGGQPNTPQQTVPSPFGSSN